MSGSVAMRTLYLKPWLVRTLPRDCCVVNVSPLLKELILHACTAGRLKSAVKRQRHVIDLVIDQLEIVETIPLQLPRVTDPRGARVAEALTIDPGDGRTLAELCKPQPRKPGGASKRTVERLFQGETGLTFGKWRQQLRLMHALRLLAEGAKITHAAMEAGYSTPSAFVSMFRKTLGTTPAQYFEGTVRKLS